jgi:hypothetical protein
VDKQNRDQCPTPRYQPGGTGHRLPRGCKFCRARFLAPSRRCFISLCRFRSNATPLLEQEGCLKGGVVSDPASSTSHPQSKTCDILHDCRDQIWRLKTNETYCAHRS